MARPRVYVARHLPGGALQYLGQHASVSLWEGGLPPPREELLSRAAVSDGLLTLLTDRVDGALL